MKDNRNLAIDRILEAERGYVNDPHDPGGCTNFGITWRTLSAWRGKRVDCGDVRTMSVGEARDIYEARYWAPVRGDELPNGLDIAVVDMAVNAGPRAATKLLQRIVGSDDDGVLGPITIKMVREWDEDTAVLIDLYGQARLRYYKSLKGWARYGRGWSNRTTETTELAISLLSNEALVGGTEMDEQDEQIAAFMDLDDIEEMKQLATHIRQLMEAFNEKAERLQI